jgi:energy-coupling factor transporter transmembrane protein EcfT
MTLIGSTDMSQESYHERPLTTRTSPSTLLWLLILAAALPLLPGGMFAGAALALMVGYVVVVRADVPRRSLLALLTVVVLAENIAFVAGVLSQMEEPLPRGLPRVGHLAVP